MHVLHPLLAAGSPPAESEGKVGLLRAVGPRLDSKVIFHFLCSFMKTFNLTDFTESPWCSEAEFLLVKQILKVAIPVEKRVTESR